MNYITVMSGVGYLILFAVVYRQIKLCRGQPEPIAWAFYALLGMTYSAYYLASYLLYGGVDAKLFNSLSSSLRLTGVITFIAIEASRLGRMKRKHGC